MASDRSETAAEIKDLRNEAAVLRHIMASSNLSLDDLDRSGAATLIERLMAFLPGEIDNAQS